MIDAIAGKVVCFGELLLRLSPPAHDLLFQTERLAAHFGGAETNVAVALARLGHNTGVVSRAPSDAVGDAAVTALRRHGVDIAGVSRAPGRLGLYYLSPGAGLRASSIVYDRKGSVFAEARDGDFDWPTLLRGYGCLHLSGITPALGHASADRALEAVRAARAAGMTVSFDGNYRANLWREWDGDPRAILTAIVAEADILFGNHRDIALLLDRMFDDCATRPHDAAAAAFAAFPRLGVIASTERSVETSNRHRLAARIDTRDRHWQTEALEIDGIVDRIGTGDAFAAGVLHALLTLGIDRAAETGLALAALKHFIPGDVSLTTGHELTAFLAGHRDVLR